MVKRQLGLKCSFCSAEAPTSEHRIAIPGPHHSSLYRTASGDWYRAVIAIYRHRLAKAQNKTIRVCSVCHRHVQIRVIVGIRTDLSEQIRSLRIVAKKYAAMRDYTAMLAVQDEVIRRMDPTMLMGEI